MQKNLLVTIILVNFNGRKFLDACLMSLEKQDFPRSRFEILMVDNNSWDNSVIFVQDRFPSVRIIESDLNLGFAGGNNLGVREAKGKYVVLLNNDTIADPTWLSSLVHRISLKESANIAAVNGKSLLYYPFLPIRIVSDIHAKSEFTDSADFQQVGVLLEHVILQNKSLQPHLHYRSGFYKSEKNFLAARWTNGNGQLLIPFDPVQPTVSFILTIRAQKMNSDLQTHISIMLEDECLVSDILSSYQVQQYEMNITKEMIDKHKKFVVQNAGNVVFKDGYVRDLGSAVKRNVQTYELDSPYFQSTRDISAFCGANVLIRKKTYMQLGGFDESFFMYYEDVDFSLRLLRLGSRIVYEPKAQIQHIHSASSNENSSFIYYFAERNHLVFILKHFPWKTIIIQYCIYIVIFIISYLRMLRWGVKGNWVNFEYWQDKSRYRFNALVWLVKHIPEFLSKRRSIVKHEKRTGQEILSQLY